MGEYQRRKIQLEEKLEELRGLEDACQSFFQWAGCCEQTLKVVADRLGREWEGPQHTEGLLARVDELKKAARAGEARAADHQDPHQ